MGEPLDGDRFEELLTELTAALVRINDSLNRLEVARGHNPELVGQLTDERFRTVTRG